MATKEEKKEHDEVTTLIDDVNVVLDKHGRGMQSGLVGVEVKGEMLYKIQTIYPKVEKDSGIIT